MIVTNPTTKKIEVMFGGKVEQWDPQQTRNVSKELGKHAIIRTNTGLIEVPRELDLENMPWNQLKSLASQKGAYKFGANREEIIRAYNAVIEKGGEAPLDAD